MNNRERALLNRAVAALRGCESLEPNNAANIDFISGMARTSGEVLKNIAFALGDIAEGQLESAAEFIQHAELTTEHERARRRQVRESWRAVT